VTNPDDRMPESLATRLQQQRILLLPGVYDALTALIAQRAGAEGLYLSGAGIAYTRFGRPDIGLVSMSEVADTIALVCDRVDLPLVVDADNGFGNALNVQRTVRVYERMGASALQIEDQQMPKRCGHLDGKLLISSDEMTGKIAAACDARQSQSTLIIARTDAIAVEGFDAALVRAEQYLTAGADVLFIEAPQSDAQVERLTQQFASRVPLLANMVEGGKTPLQNVDALQAIGYKIAIFPGGVVRRLALSAQQYYQNLLEHGSNENLRNQMFDFNGLNDLIGTSDMLATASRYDNTNGSQS